MPILCRHTRISRSGLARISAAGSDIIAVRAGDVTLSFLRDPLEFLTEKQRSHEGGVARITLAGKPVLLVWDPAVARAVFEGDDSFQKVVVAALHTHQKSTIMCAGSLCDTACV